MSAKVAAVILAAGRSSRMPDHKMLALLSGKPLMRHVAEAALESRAATVIVVTGYRAAETAATLRGLAVTIVENLDYANGLSESLKCGVRSVPADCSGMLVLLGDMPLVTTGTIDRLISTFAPDSGAAICVPARHGRRGNPVLWARQFFPDMLRLDGDKGAKHLMDLHGDLVMEVEAADDSVLIDIDTPEDLARL